MSHTDEALLLHSGVLGFKSPAENALKAFKNFFELEPGSTQLRGSSSRILVDESDPVS